MAWRHNGILGVVVRRGVVIPHGGTDHAVPLRVNRLQQCLVARLFAAPFGLGQGGRHPSGTESGELRMCVRRQVFQGPRLAPPLVVWQRLLS